MTAYKILYVDDEPDLLLLGKTFLEKTGDFCVDTCESVPEGLSALRARSYDAVISDYMMPDLDGLDFLKAVRSEFFNLPFILFTGRGREDVVIEAINNGADFYLQKGGAAKAQFAELAHKLRMAIERQRAVAERAESEKRLSTIFHASPIHQMITEFATDRIIDINDRFLQDLGMSRKEVIGRTMQEINLTPDPGQMAQLKSELETSGIVRNVPVTLRGKTGTVYISLTSMTRVQVGGRDLIYTQSVDISPQKKAEQTINALLNAPSDVLMLLGTNGTILAANQAAAARYKIPVPDLIGRDAYTLTSPDYAPRRRERVAEIIRTRQPLTYSDDQSGRVYENHLYPVLDSAGSVSAVAVFSHDTTDEIAAKRALRFSEEKYRLVVEHSHDSIYIYRGDRFLFINQQAEDLTGYSHEELMQLDIWDFLHPDDREHLKQQALKRFAGGNISSSFEARIQKKDGTVRDGQFFVDLVDFSGEPAILGIARDITEQKHAKEAIREREQQIRSLADNLPSGLVYQVIVEPDGAWHIAHISAGVEEIHEVTAQDEMRNPSLFYSQVLEEYRQPFIEAFQQAVLTKSPMSYEMRIRTPSGKIRWVLTRAAPRQISNDRIVLDGIELDITAAKQREEELRAAYEQLAASQEQLQGHFLALQESQDQIAESEEKYRTLVEHTDDGVFVAQDGNLIFVNETLANRIGYAPEELIGKSFAFLVAPEDRDLVTSRHYQRLSGQALPDTYEFSLLHKDGSTRYLVRIRVGTGRFRGAPAVIGTLHDVTEERAQQTALAESEARFRGLTEQSLDTIMLFDRELRHRYVSPMAEKISGIPVAKFIGKTHAELGFPAHLVTIWEDALKKAFSTGKINRIEFLLPTSGIWIDWQLVPVMGPDGKVAEVIASSRDITDRKKTEQALLESEEKYRDLVENANIIILKWDKAGNITFFNTYAQRFFGYTGEEIIGKPVVGTIVPETESTSGRDLGQMIDEILRYPEKYADNENENITRDGRRVWIRWQNKPLFDKNGEFIGQICIGSDNTDRKKAEEALAKSEELHRKMIVAIPDVVVTADLEGIITFINDQGVRLAGVTDAAEIVGKSMFSFFAPECLEMARENTRRMFEGPLGPKEYIFLAGGNRKVTLEVNGDVLRTPDGKPYGLLYICRDITERRQAQEAIQQSEELYRSLADASPDGIAILDTKGYLTYVSPRALEMFRLSNPNEAIGTNVLDWLDPADREQARQQFAPVLSGSPHDFRMYRMRRKDKSSFVIELHSTVFHDPRGSVSGIISILRDITERQKAEQALRESEDNYRRIIENMQDVFYRVDNKGVVTMISTYGAHLMGYASPEEIIGKLRVDDVYVNLDERHTFLAVLNEKGVVTGYPLTVKDRNGKLHAATASSRLLYDKNGMVAGIEGILHDVTKIREVETALRQANRQITLMTRITRHDIRNQLLALNGWLELSRASVDDPDRMLEIIDREQKIAASIGHQIEFTTVFDDMGLKPPVWHNLRELIHRAAAAIPFNPVVFACAVPAIEVLADPLLEKVFYNLLDNALRYGGSGLSHVRVSARDDARALVLVVEDNGDGIPKSDKERIFDQGFGKNTGLGLFLVREVLSITGITICEAGMPGRGARFEISVPRDRYRFIGKDPSFITANPS